MVVSTFRGNFREFDALLESIGRTRSSLVGTRASGERRRAQTRTLPRTSPATEFFDAERHPEIRFESDRHPGGRGRRRRR